MIDFARAGGAPSRHTKTNFGGASFKENSAQSFNVSDIQKCGAVIAETIPTESDAARSSVKNVLHSPMSSDTPKNPVDVYVGGRIAELRRRNNLTARDVAGKINADPEGLLSIERGDAFAGADTLAALAEALGAASPVLFFYGAPSEFAPPRPQSDPKSPRPIASTPEVTGLIKDLLKVDDPKMMSAIHLFLAYLARENKPGGPTTLN
ncbi:MAG: helix-turn-helix domain-containing protein [Pseudomonadota bacterium]